MAQFLQRTARSFIPNLSRISGASSIRGYREIKITEEENVTTIEGFMHEDDNTKYLERDNLEDTCPIRSRGIQVTYEDVLILNQFITSTGEVLPRSVTGLCAREHRKVTTAVKMAQRANLLPGEESRMDEKGNEIPKLNRYLTRFPIGSQNAIKSRGPNWKKRYFKIGDPIANQDSPNISNKKLRLGH